MAVAVEGLPLRRGDEGKAVRDLQRRLAAVGHHPTDDAGVYGAATEQAVRAFQGERRLRVDGICGQHTWGALVEAGHRLGDRALYLAQPMLRGDDVAVLQRRLGELGFDAGRVDGIFGPATDKALLDFQRNTGLVTDAIAGPATLVALDRLTRRGGVTEPVVGLRERELLRQGPRTLEGRTVVVGEMGGLDALVKAVGRVVTAAGAVAVVVQHPDGSEQAAQANAARADAYVGLLLGEEDASCTTGYYAGLGWESPGGRRLAELVQQALPAVLKAEPGRIRGLSTPVLRETRMPAILCELAPPSLVVERGAELAAVVGGALRAWVAGAGES